MIEIASPGLWMDDDIQQALGPDFYLHHLTRTAHDDPRALANVRALIAYAAGYPIGAELLARMPSLRLIVVMGAGADQVDQMAARRREIQIRTCHGTNAEDVAEYAMAMTLALWCGVGEANRDMQMGDWRPVVRRRLSGRRLGIFGMGSVGQAVARKAAGLGMIVAYASRSAKPTLPYEQIDGIRELAKQVDVLVLAAPATPQTQGIVDAGLLDAIGPDGVLINIARGVLVDEEELIRALRERRLGGAALDVFRNEPDPTPAVRGVPNLLLSPHVASFTEEAGVALMQQTVAHIIDFFDQSDKPTGPAQGISGTHP